MLIKLPIEVWRDCFDWLSAADRRQLASKFNDIPDVEFSDICQRWLHVWSRNLSLEKLRIDGTEGDPAGASVQIWNQEEIDLLVEGLPIAETALPANIKSFELIEIRCLNNKVLDFLQQMQHLFRNVVLDVDNREKIEDRNDEEKKEATRTTLRHLLPLLTAGVETVTMHNSQFCFTIREMFSDQQFFGLKQIEVQEMFKPGTLTNALIELLLLWLGTGRDDGQPRFLLMGNFFFYGDNGLDVNALRFIESIRQHFMNATKAVSFFIDLVVGPPFPPFNNIQESTIQNAGTQEQLLVRKPEPNILYIDRCSTGENGQQWMERNHFPAIDQRQIAVVSPKLGSFEQPKVQANEEEDVNQPGPSKKQKLT